MSLLVYIVLTFILYELLCLDIIVKAFATVT